MFFWKHNIYIWKDNSVNHIYGKFVMFIMLDFPMSAPDRL